MTKFIEENKQVITEALQKGETIILLGYQRKGKTTMLKNIVELFKSSAEDLYESCVDVESIFSSRILADKSSKVAYMVADYDSVKYLERYLKSDFSVTEDMVVGCSKLGLILTAFPITEITLENAKDLAIQILKNNMSIEQVDKLLTSNIHVILCDKDNNDILV